MLLTSGERQSTALLSMALRSRGLDAVSFTGSQVGIITDDSHADARISEIRGFRLRDALHRDRIPIVAGFQGVSPEREITTLGRGGSDTTAVALAAHFGAGMCEIYTDVLGVSPKTRASFRACACCRSSHTRRCSNWPPTARRCCIPGPARSPPGITCR